LCGIARSVGKVAKMGVFWVGKIAKTGVFWVGKMAKSMYN